jgi:hypothetical protein
VWRRLRSAPGGSGQGSRCLPAISRRGREELPARREDGSALPVIAQPRPVGHPEVVAREGLPILGPSTGNSGGRELRCSSASPANCLLSCARPPEEGSGAEELRCHESGIWQVRTAEVRVVRALCAPAHLVEVLPAARGRVRDLALCGPPTRLSCSVETPADAYLSAPVMDALASKVPECEREVSHLRENDEKSRQTMAALEEERRATSPVLAAKTREMQDLRDEACARVETRCVPSRWQVPYIPSVPRHPQAATPD